MIKKTLVLLTICSVTRVALAESETKETKLKIGDPAPKLQCGQFVQGEPVATLEKGKVYVVEFWATWCGPCRESIPHLNELAKKYQDKGVVVIGQNVSEDDDKKVVPAFVKKMGEKMTYRVALDDKSKDEQGAMSATWMDAAGQNGIPTAFVVDKEGKIAWIGHPMDGLDKVLEGVEAGTFDARKHAETKAAKDKTLEEKTEKLDAAMDDKKWDEANAILDELAKLLPAEEAASLWEPRLISYLQKKDNAAATKLLTQLGDQHKDDAKTLNEMAYSITMSEDTKPVLSFAEKFAARANELTQDKDPEILDTLARVTFIRGDKDKAIELQNKAISLADDKDLKDDLKNTLKCYQKGILPDAEEEGETAPGPMNKKMDEKK